MAGLFELQLPNESGRRNSKAVREPRLSSSRARSNSPTPEATAKEIVSQLVAKQQAQAVSSVAANSSSIFPWRRRATASTDVPRQSRDSPSRNSADGLRRISDSSEDQKPKKQGEKLSSGRRSIVASTPPKSPRASSSIDFTFTPSTPGPSTLPKPSELEPPRAATALVQAGLGLGLPPISFPGPSSPALKPLSVGRKPAARPGTSHGHEESSTSSLSFRVGTIRRVKSFSRDEEKPQSRPYGPSPGRAPDETGDVLVFSRDRAHLATPPVFSMPERLPNDTKGKGRERGSRVGPSPLPEETQLRGRQVTPSLLIEARDKSATRRVWWPGRRRIDSSPVGPQPTNTPPPPIPMRSQDRPGSSGTSTPSLPSFRPFSPLMGEFRMTDSPRLITSFEDPNHRFPRGLDEAVSSLSQEEGVAVRRRHSLTNRIGRTHANTEPTSTQGTNPSPHQLRRYSQSLTNSEQGLTSSALLPRTRLSSPLDGTCVSRPQSPDDVSFKTTRRRSMTVSSLPISTPAFLKREIPLLLRHPLNRPGSSGGPPDPFISVLGANSSARPTAEVPSDVTTLTVDPVNIRRTPSTSSGSTSSLSLSQSASANRLTRKRSGTAPPASLTLTASSTSTSLPPLTTTNRLLRRLSSTFFNTSSMAMTSPIEPPSTDVNLTTNTSGLSHSGPASTNSPATSDGSSLALSKENLANPDGVRMSIEGLKQKPRKPPIKLPDETPEAYLSRLIDAVSKAEVAHVLAASGDEFYTQSLRLYFEQFNFEDDPIDVALRKLLMEVGLPRETQQIDRVMEVFAARYVSCNPGLFVDDDHPYILAFSLIMLHTDAFNRSNKNKMSKNDYVKNTKLPGIPPEILECFFDNIVFAPFIFIEDPVDANPTKTSLSDGTSRHNPLSMPPTNNSGVLGNSTGTTILGKANKIDPYYLITQNLLGPLRADIHDHLPKSNPFLYEGTEWPWDTQRLHHLFALAQVVQVHVDTTSPPSPNPGTSSTLSTPTRRKSVVLPSLAVGYGPFIGSPPFSSDGLSSPPRISTTIPARAQDARILRIARAGVLARKEDTTEGGKKSTNRKWRAWSVVLTGSQLLFFRDPNFASHLLGLPMDGPNDSAPEHGLLNPDEIVSLQGCIAVFDTTYTKYPHTFRFLISTGRQFIMQAPDERSLNEWISTINYACAFKSVGVQMRGLGLSHKDVAMTGVAAATSHLHDLRILNRATASTLVHTYGEHPAPQDTESLPSRPPSSGSSPRQGTGSKLLRSFIVPPSQVDLEMSKPHQLEGAQQFKATFDEVKAELAAQNTEQLRPLVSGRARTLSMGTHPSTIQSIKQSSRPDTTGSASRSEDMQHTTTNVVQSRSDIIQSNVETLDTQITGVQHELDAELRVARNLAILTPFQRATRDRIQVAVVPLAKRVKTLRINLARLVCYRFVLLTDLAEEERQWEQAKRDALKAATQRLSAADVQPPGIEWSPSSPRFPMDPPPTSETFYSTLDVPGSEPPAIVSPLVSMAPDHRAVLYSPSGVHHEYNGTRSTVTPSHFGPELSPVAYSNGHDHGSTATEVLEEIAEEWNETRAAKRVSLVKLPSEVKLSILRRQERNLDNDDRRWRGAESPTSFLNLS